MKRAGGMIAIAALVACAELRSAAPPSDAGASASDASKETSDGRRVDAGPNDAEAGGEPCPAPCAPEIVTTMDNLGPLVVDSFRAYFGAANGGVWKIAKTGGAATKLGDGKTTRIALANDRLFWGEGDHLVSCSINGCGGIPEGLLLGQTGIDEVVSDGTKVVWHAHVGADDLIRTCPAANCNSSTAEEVSSAFNLRAGVGIGAGKIFWVDVQTKLHACPLDPLPCLDPQSIGPGSNDAVVFDRTVYWVHDAVIFSSPVDAATPKKIGGSENPHLLVADERHVYWREMVHNQVLRCPIGGCDPAGPEVLADEVNGVFYGGLALDSEYVYWTSKSGLWRRHK